VTLLASQPGNNSPLVSILGRNLMQTFRGSRMQCSACRLQGCEVEKRGPAPCHLDWRVRGSNISFRSLAGFSASRQKPTRSSQLAYGGCLQTETAISTIVAPGGIISTGISASLLTKVFRGESSLLTKKARGPKPGPDVYCGLPTTRSLNRCHCLLCRVISSAQVTGSLPNSSLYSVSQPPAGFASPSQRL
jgi:hypothetical protein